MSTVIAQYHDEAEWLRIRDTGLGGSDIPALFGEHPWKTPYDLWLEKTGKVARDVRESADQRRGRLHESVAVQLYVERTGNRVRRQPLRRHPDYPFLLCSIDRQVFARDGKPTRALEIKCPRSWVYHRIRREGLPPYAILQGQQEAGVWGYSETEYGVYGSDEAELLVFPVPFDAAVWDRVVNEAGEFWTQHVEKDVPPPQEQATATVELPEVSGEVTFRDDDGFYQAAAEWQEAKEIAEEATALRAAAKDRIIGLVEQEPGCFETADHAFRFYYSPREGRRSFDEKALRAHGALDPIRVMAWLSTGKAEQDLTEGPERWAELRKELALNLDAFVKRGAPYYELRGYRLRASEL